ncbi:hypothetical protein TNCV_697781 [Trichonephila clavipes]|nr:hypothetical protein TNCV_697781 [Trichonephila clavipes]
MKKIPDNDEDLNIEDSVQTPKISHSEGLKVIETAFQHFERHEPSVMDIVFLRRLRDEATKCRVLYGREYNITNFFKKRNEFL